MASISVPCPKCSVIPRNGTSSQSSRARAVPLASLLRPGPSSAPRSARFPSSQDAGRGHFPVLKAQFKEVAVETSSNSTGLPSVKSMTSPTKKDGGLVDESAAQDEVTEATISAFMAEVSSLVKLVDSKDITELHLKKEGCELLIRKKEALPPPPVAASPVMMQYPPTMFPPQQSPHVLPPPTQGNTAPPAAPPALPPPSAGSKSSLPSLKCPMAGTFYRCPAPGEPPFVKVGDKVQKGQVVCIIEAMKLMNEIEADQSGTVVEIIAEDGKPVSVDTALLIIQP